MIARLRRKRSINTCEDEGERSNYSSFKEVKKDEPLIIDSIIIGNAFLDKSLFEGFQE